LRLNVLEGHIMPQVLITVVGRETNGMIRVGIGLHIK